jgi:hypothetical protein
VVLPPGAAASSPTVGTTTAHYADTEPGIHMVRSLVCHFTYGPIHFTGSGDLCFRVETP